MSWQILVLAQAFLVAASTVVLRFLAREKKLAGASFVINGGLYIPLYLVGLAFALKLGHVDSHVLGRYWGRFIEGGIAFGLTNVCLYKVLTYFDAAVAIVLTTVNVIATVLLAALVLHEELTTVQIGGSVLLLAAICYGALATRPATTGRRRRFQPVSLIYVVAGACCYAVAMVNEKSLLGDMSLASYSVFGWGAQAAVSLVAMVLLQPKQIVLLWQPKTAGFTALAGAIRGLGGVCFMLAQVKSNNISLLTVISYVRVIFVLFLGMWLLRERQFLIAKFKSAGLAIMALALMLWK